MRRSAPQTLLNLLTSVVWTLTYGCAASSSARSAPNDSAANSAPSHVAVSPAKAQPAPSPRASASDERVGQNKAPLPKRDCRVSVVQGKAGSSNKAGVARVALAETQENANGQLVRRNSGPNFEWVESMEFSKDGPNKPGLYSLEFRREDGDSCALKVSVTEDDLNRGIILFLYITSM